jgi:hypothetical protein
MVFKNRRPPCDGHHEDRVEGQSEGDHAAQIEDAHGSHVGDEQRADRHAGDHPALEPQDDDGGAAGLLVRRSHRQDVRLHADKQHALTDTRDRPCQEHDVEVGPDGHDHQAGAGQRQADVHQGPRALVLSEMPGWDQG